MPATSRLCAGLALAACTAPPPKPLAEDPVALRAKLGVRDQPEQAPAPASPKTCPPGHVAERLSGALAGLASVAWEGDKAILSGTFPGDAMPPAPTELTVIREHRTERARTFELKLYPPAENGFASYMLEIPLARAPGPERERGAFVTDACLDISVTTKLRLWTGIPLSRQSIEARQALGAEVSPYLQEQLPADDWRALERSGGLYPAAVAELTSTLPGCPRVVVVDDNMGQGLKPAYDFVSALLCMDGAGAVVRAVVPPERGPAIDEFALVDLDADGIDELIYGVALRKGDITIRTRDILVAWDAAASEFRRTTLVSQELE